MSLLDATQIRAFSAFAARPGGLWQTPARHLIVAANPETFGITTDSVGDFESWIAQGGSIRGWLTKNFNHENVREFRDKLLRESNRSVTPALWRDGVDTTLLETAGKLRAAGSENHAQTAVQTLAAHPPLVTDDKTIEGTVEPAGYALAVWQTEIARYAALEDGQKVRELIRAGQESGYLPGNHPCHLGSSWFGIHITPLTFIASLPVDWKSIACYGAGFHDESDMLLEMAEFKLEEGELEKDDYDAVRENRYYLQQAQRHFIGHAISYQPRELMLMFLPDQIKGTLTVFDRDSRLTEELSKPRFVWLNGREALLEYPEKLFISYWEYLHSNNPRRNVQETIYKKFRESALIARRFDLLPHEIEKFRPVQADLITDDISQHPEGGGFKLSIMLQTIYFMPGILIVPAFARVVNNMDRGGVLFMDYDFPEPIVDHFGLQQVQFDNMPEQLFAYIKIEESAEARALSALHV